jgi:hypothetical protein
MKNAPGSVRIPHLVARISETFSESTGSPVEETYGCWTYA